MKILTPNAKLNDRAVLFLLLCEGLIGLIVWCVSPFVFLPKPLEIWNGFLDLWGQGLVLELLTSVSLNLQAIALATVVSLVLAWLSTMPVFSPLVAGIGKLRFLSMVGLTFFFTVLTTNGHQLKLLMLVFSVTVFFVTGMADVLSQIPKEQYDLARVLKMNPWRSLYEVVILGQADKAFDVLRQNAAIGWMMLSFTESMSRSEGGIGAMLTTQNKYFHLSSIFAIQIIILVLGLGQDYALGFLKRFFCPYAELTTDRVPTYVQSRLLK